MAKNDTTHGVKLDASGIAFIGHGVVHGVNPISKDVHFTGKSE
jgi:hypothetical protein